MCVRKLTHVTLKEDDKAHPWAVPWTVGSWGAGGVGCGWVGVEAM